MSENYNSNINGLPQDDTTATNKENAAFNALMEKSQRTELESKLQSARVGGYSKKSVEDFVTDMRSSLQQVKAQLERQIRDLAAEKASVTQECTVLRTQLKTAVETLASRNQTEDQPYDGSQAASEQDLKQLGMENEQLRSLLLNYQADSGDKKKYEELLAQKQFEIAQLNESLVQYRDDCNALKEKTEQLENMVNNSLTDNELPELRRQKDEIESNYQELLQQMEKTNLELEQIKRYLDETETQLEQKKQHLDETETQLEQKKQHLDETETQLEQKKQHLDETETQLEQKKQHLDETETRLGHKKQHLEESETQLEQKKQQMEETETQLAQKKQRLDESEIQLEHKKQYLDEMQMQLEQEKAYLTVAREQLEQKKQQLDMLQTQLEQEKEHLEDTQAQLELKKKQLSEVQAILEAEINAKEYVGRMKDFDFDGSRSPEDWQDDSSGEKLFESLYVHFSQLKSKADQQESIIAENEKLLEKYRNLENETVVLRQERENAKEIIASLKSSFEQVMSEMDEQSETLNRYISRSRRDRETLKSALIEGKAPQPHNAEVAEQENTQTAKIEELEEENAQLEEAILKPYGQILRFDNAKRTIPLNNYSKENLSEASDGAEEDTMKELTKAADI